MYGEEFVQNSINSGSNNRDEGHNAGNTSAVSDTKSNNLREVETDQKCTGKAKILTAVNVQNFRALKSFQFAENQTGQFSGGDEETEAEDQVDHVGMYPSGYPTYTTTRSVFSKGDFSFGESELDMELETINSGKNQ